MVDTNLSLVDRLWQLFTFAVIASGGTIAALQAKASELFKGAGAIGWIGIGLTASLLISICFALIRYSGVKGSEKQYFQSMSLRGGNINPLQDSFSDVVINIHDLHLPGQQVHAKKHFKRCVFVGPGAIAFMGGSLSHNEFSDIGDIIAIPRGTRISGITILDNCTLDQCTFIRVSIVTSEEMKNALLADAGKSS